MTTAELAARNVVSTSTVRRWARSGAPLHRAEVLDSLRIDDEIKARVRVRKRIKNLSADSLSAMAGVAISTANKWIKKGEIPKRYLVFFTGEKKTIRGKQIDSRYGLGDKWRGHTRGTISTLKFRSAKLNANTFHEIKLFITKNALVPANITKNTRFHCVASVQMNVETSDKAGIYNKYKVYLPEKTYKLVKMRQEQGKKPPKFFETVITGTNQATRKNAWKSLREQLLEVVDYVDYILSVTLYSRNPIEVK